MWFFRRQRRPPAQPPDDPRLRRARRIALRLEGIGGVPGVSRLEGVRVPGVQYDLEDGLLADFDDLAQRMATAQRQAELEAQISTELLKGAQAIQRSKERTDDRFTHVVDQVQEAFRTLGLTPPPMRDEAEVLAAQRRLQREIDQLAAQVA